MNQALTMSDEEARSRWEDLHNHVTTQTAQAFVTTFLNRCVRSNAEHSYSMDGDSASMAFGLSGHHTVVPHLGPQLLISKFKHSSRRLILVDFEGTLRRRDLTKKGVLEIMEMIEGLEKGGELPKEVEETVGVIGKLSEDWKNEVWLLSGLRVKGVLEKIVERVPEVGIVAENGCFVKMRDDGVGGGGEWISMVSNLNLTWKGACLEILSYYVSFHFFYCRCFFISFFKYVVHEANSWIVY